MYTTYTATLDTFYNQHYKLVSSCQLEKQLEEMSRKAARNNAFSCRYKTDNTYTCYCDLLLFEDGLLLRRASSASSSSMLMPSILESATFGAAGTLVLGILLPSSDSFDGAEELEVSPHAICADSALRLAMSGSTCSAISSETSFSSALDG